MNRCKIDNFWLDYKFQYMDNLLQQKLCFDMHIKELNIYFPLRILHFICCNLKTTRLIGFLHFDKQQLHIHFQQLRQLQKPNKIRNFLDLLLMILYLLSSNQSQLYSLLPTTYRMWMVLNQVYIQIFSSFLPQINQQTSLNMKVSQDQKVRWD